MSPIIEVFSQIDWKEVVGGISSVAFLIGAIAALGGVLRVRDIVEALREFRKSKSELSELLDAIDRLGELTPKLKNVADDLEDAKDKVLEHREIQKTEQSLTNEPVSFSEKESESNTDVSNRWHELRDIWRGVRDEIESRIDNLDGRRKRSYNRLYRHNYTDIVNMLVIDKQLTQAEADATINMNLFLLSRKNQDKSNITDADVEKFKAWRDQFFQASAQNLPNTTGSDT